jgi:pyruvate,water dikinase
MIAAARSAQKLNEDVRRAAMRELHLLRKALLALDRRFDLKNGIFLLSLDEMVALSNADCERVRELVASREAERASIALTGTLPARLSLAAVETASWLAEDRIKTQRRHPQRRCFGVRVSGARCAGGAACVVDEAAALAGKPLSRLMPGDVLVAPFIHEAWLGEVVRASGVILSGGGWLCNTAIIAREWNIAMTVDVAGWRDIPDGQHVTLELDGSIRIDEPHRAPTKGVPIVVGGSA